MFLILGVPNWIELASDPNSDELAMILIDADADIYGMRWTGSSWDNMGVTSEWDVSGSSAVRKSIDVAFETNSGDIMFIWGSSVTADDCGYLTYSGGALSAYAALPNANAGGQPNWIKLARNPNSSSNGIMLGIQDAGADLNTFFWNGTAWSAVHTEHDASTETATDMNFDIVFETHSSNTDDAWLVWGEGALIRRRLWNGPTSAWSGTTTTSDDDTAQVNLAAQPNSGAVLAIGYESDAATNDDIVEIHQTGGVQTWSASSIIWGGPVARRLGNFYYDIDAQAYNSSTKAMVVYDAQDAESVPKYRRWTSSTWSAEEGARIVDGQIRHMIVRFSPTRNEAILATLGSNGRLETQVWDGTGWGTPTLITTMADALGSYDTQSLYRGYDLEYERSSGDAVIVYGDGTSTPDYQIWDGSAWVDGTGITVPTTGIPNWIELSASEVSGSDDLALIYIDSNIDVYGLRWNGSTWNNMGDAATWDIQGANATRRCIDVGFEKTSGDIMFLWGDNTATTHWNYRTYSAGALSSLTTLANANQGGVANWLKLYPNPTSGSNEIMLGSQDAGADLNTIIWNGTSWGTVHTEHSAGVESATDKTFDIDYETYPGNENRARLAYGAGANITRKRWNGTAWDSTTTAGDDTMKIIMTTQPASGAILAIIYEDDTSASDDIKEMRLTNGALAWTAPSTVWGGPVRRNLGLNLIDLAAEQYYVDFTQNDFEYFVDGTSVTLNNAWPPDNGEDITENTPLAQIPASNMTLKQGDKIRLQMNLGVSRRDLATNTYSFKLQSAQAEDCTAATGWTDVGGIGAASAWRLYDNASLASSVTQVNQISTSSLGAEGLYSETIPSLTNPYLVDKDTSQITEWDWPLENNTATENTSYCFRMIETAGYEFTTYNADGYPKIVTSPGVANLMRHGNFFQNDAEKGYFWAN